MSKVEKMDEILADRIADLPPEIQPATDLWPAIETRLQDRSPESASHGRPPGPGPGQPVALRPFRSWGLQAVAALFFMALGAAVTYWAVRPTTDGQATVQASNVDVEERVSTAEVLPASAVSTGERSLDLVEANYLRAREALWLHAVTHRDSLPPGTLKVVEKNLEILERAIGDLRAALELDPGNPALERRLMDNHQRSIDLLRRIVRDV